MFLRNIFQVSVYNIYIYRNLFEVRYLFATFYIYGAPYQFNKNACKKILAHQNSNYKTTVLENQIIKHKNDKMQY